MKHIVRSQAAAKQVSLLQRGVIEADVSKVLREAMRRHSYQWLWRGQRWRGLEVERIRGGDDVALSLGSTGAIIRETLACGGGV